MCVVVYNVLSKHALFFIFVELTVETDLTEKPNNGNLNIY